MATKGNLRFAFVLAFMFTPWISLMLFIFLNSNDLVELMKEKRENK